MQPLFDPRRADLHRRRARAAAKEGADFLVARAIDELVERLAAVKRHFALCVDVSTPSEALSSALLSGDQIDSVVRFDRLPPQDALVPSVIADAEALPLGANSIDLAVSALALQTVNDLPGALAQIRFALKPDGLFLGALLGGETLTELRQSLASAEEEIRGGATPRVAPFAGINELGALLQRAGFALPVVDYDRVTVRYDNALSLMCDLRAMGATNILVESDRRPLTRAILERCEAIYADRYADTDGRITATFDIAWLSGWAPHDSQQKPLRPGSATVRLADALGTSEISAGERAKPRD